VSAEHNAAPAPTHGRLSAIRQWLRDLPIPRKIVAVVTATSTAALLVSSASLLAIDAIRYAEDMREDLRAIASIIGDNTTGALAFGDRVTAEQLLSALAAKRQVEAAAIYDRTNALFASYRSTSGVPLPSTPGSDGLRVVAGGMEIVQPIEGVNGRIGSIYVRTSQAAQRMRLRTSAFTVGLVLLAAVLIAVLLSGWLQRLVSEPLLSLAHTARRVSAQRDYTVRARVAGGDEVGTLVSAFNEMLAQIARRDDELWAAKNTLEERVVERTAQLEDQLAERRRAERELEQRNRELEHANRELDDFAYIASHDLKEPLRGIHNYAQFLDADYGNQFDAEGRRKLDTIVRLSRRMEMLIESLLQYSRVGRADLVLEAVDVQEVVDDVLDRLAILLREHRTEVRIPERLPTIVTDRVRLGEVFANLVANAVKYNDKPMRWIEIGTSVAGTGGNVRADEHVFHVRDNGIGIAERHREVVFRIFKRLHPRDDFGGGTGAGLTIVRKIVERQHGRAWIESVPGEGTTVFFTLRKES
jgi:signal transduction histidine kinase